MNTSIARRKASLQLVLLIALLGALDIQLTHIFISLGGDEGNNLLFFASMLNENYTAGVLYMASCKLLGILVLLKGIMLLKVIPKWLTIVLHFTVAYYVLGIIYSLDFIIYATYQDSILHSLFF